jgi:hypothetical protein
MMNYGLYTMDITRVIPIVLPDIDSSYTAYVSSSGPVQLLVSLLTLTGPMPMPGTSSRSTVRTVRFSFIKIRKSIPRL